MAYTVPDTEPATLVAGDTATWRKALADFPASAGWVLSYTLINSANKITITASASGDEHLVSVTAATTVSWTAGRYRWQSAVALAGARHTLAGGSVEIKPNIAAATTYDARSHARKVLEAIEAILESRATGDDLDTVSMAYGDKSVTRDKAQLLVLRDRYRLEVRAEDDAARLANGLPTRNKILVRL